MSPTPMRGNSHTAKPQAAAASGAQWLSFSALIVRAVDRSALQGSTLSVSKPAAVVSYSVLRDVPLALQHVSLLALQALIITASTATFAKKNATPIAHSDRNVLCPKNSSR
eukprot:6912-Heterococcus_DN1.PRE.1